jgi:hypothetical protein
LLIGHLGNNTENDLLSEGSSGALDWEVEEDKAKIDNAAGNTGVL